MVSHVFAIQPIGTIPQPQKIGSPYDNSVSLVGNIEADLFLLVEKDDIVAELFRHLPLF